MDTLHQLRHLEDIRGCNGSPKSSCASVASSGTLTSDGQRSSADFSPKSLEKHSRPINHVLMETEVKGTLIERLEQVEDRVMKVKKTTTWTNPDRLIKWYRVRSMLIWWAWCIVSSAVFAVGAGIDHREKSGGENWEEEDSHEGIEATCQTICEGKRKTE